MLPFGHGLMQTVRAAPASATLAIVYLGIFPGALAYVGWAYVLSHGAAGRTTTLLYLIPIVAIGIAWIWVAEMERSPKAGRTGRGGGGHRQFSGHDRGSARRGLDARMMDARSLTFDGEFDAVFSNAALHWVKDDPDAPISGAFRALKAGGWFVGEMGGHGCAVRSPWRCWPRWSGGAFVTPLHGCPATFRRSTSMKAACGGRALRRKACNWFRARHRAKGMRGWLETFANAYCCALPPGERNAFLDEVTALKSASVAQNSLRV